MEDARTIVQYKKNMDTSTTKKLRLFVLVHGMGHGAWSWHKVATLLKSAGHRVTALDLGASGVNPKQLNEMKSVFDYVQPLMDFMNSLPQEERVILVGHSFGGIAISLAMENFSSKIDLAVFVTAVMPNYTSPPGTIIQELLQKATPDSLLDCQFSFEQEGLENPPTSFLFGPDYMETKMYKCCQPEDVMLGQLLVRPAKFFIEDVMNDTLLTKDKYGSVKRVFVVCDEDEVMDGDFQKWIIKNSNPMEEAKVIKGADHMVMLSKPHELSLYLQEIIKRFVHT